MNGYPSCSIRLERTGMFDMGWIVKGPEKIDREQQAKGIEDG